MKEQIKITITFLIGDNIVLCGEKMLDLTEDDIIIIDIDTDKMPGGLAKASSILQEGDFTDGNA